MFPSASKGSQTKAEFCAIGGGVPPGIDTRVPGICGRVRVVEPETGLGGRVDCRWFPQTGPIGSPSFTGALEINCIRPTTVYATGSP
jgi:hypothetical protein